MHFEDSDRHHDEVCHHGCFVEELSESLNGIADLSADFADQYRVSFFGGCAPVPCVCECPNEGVGFLPMLVAVGDEVVAFGVEGWVGGDEVDARLGEFPHLLKVITAD